MKRTLSVMLLAVAALSSCNKPVAPAPKSKALAQVGLKEIFPADLVAEVQRRVAAEQPVPDKETLLNEMVMEEGMVQRAVALGLDKDPEVVRTWRSLLIGTLKARQLEPKLKEGEISAAEVLAHYDANQASYAQPEKARIGLIFAAVPPRAPAEQAAPIQARMDEARAMAAAGAEGFKQAAVKFSEHQGSRYRGGEIGWVMRGKSPSWLPEKVAETAFALSPGALSKIIADKDGLYLVTLLEHTPASIRPLAQMETSIRSSLTKQRQASQQKAFDENIRQLAGVVTFSENLKAIELPVPRRPAAQPPVLPGTARN